MTERSLPADDPVAAAPAPGVVLLLTTFPDRERAEAAARDWVAAGLAACVHVAPVGTSIYAWQGTLEASAEVAVTAKTVATRVEALHEALRSAHPYQTPEVLLLEPAGGSTEYLDWVRSACRPGTVLPAAS